MFSPVLAVLAVLVQPNQYQVGSSELRADEPPVRLWINGNRRFEPGERARVQVEARDDGYLLVLNYDTDGRVRVLFPMDASDDAFVRGGRRYEVRSDRDRESFLTGDAGSGFVLVALSPDPWEIGRWARGSGWDYDLIAIDRGSDDPERDLTRLVEGLASNRGFDYDLVEYFVDDVEIVQYEYRSPGFYGPGVFAGDPWCDPFWSSGWYCGGRSGLRISYGRYYSGDWWSIGYGPSWYWPYNSGYYYNPYSYGRGYTHTTYYRPWVIPGRTYRPGAGQPIISGRPRDYQVDRATPWSFNGRGTGTARPAAGAGDDYRPRAQSNGRARPVARPQADREVSGARPATARPAAGSAGRDRVGAGNARPAARPAAARPAARSAPSAGRAPANPPARARARGGRGNDDDGAAAVRTSAPARTSVAAPRGTRSSAPPSRAIAAPTSRPQAAARGSSPAASRPAAPRPAASRPAASRPAPTRSAPSAARAQPSRGSSGASTRGAAPARARGGRQGN
jgi:hypothetical protein